MKAWQSETRCKKENKAWQVITLAGYTYRKEGSEVQAEEEVNALDKAGETHVERGAVGALVSGWDLWLLQKGRKSPLESLPVGEIDWLLGSGRHGYGGRMVVRIEDVNEVE